MIYHIAKYLQQYFSFFNMFHYVSFRAIVALLSSIFCSLAFGGWFIKNIASRESFKSRPREWTPDNHLKKNETPTMGGLFIIAICIINIFLWCNLLTPNIWFFISCLVGFGLIGLLDDLKKLKLGKGISISLKFFLQFEFAILLVLAWYYSTDQNTTLCVPFFKNLMFPLGCLIIPWAIFIIVGTSNAVNLTDGLDGLATGPLMTNFATFSVISYLAGHKFLAKYLHIPFSSSSSEMTIIGATLVGTLLGFLWYNTYPAQIFMGDVGSLALGASLAFMAIISRQELLLILAGGIFVLETVSVMIQIFTFRVFGKRMFRMAPIHHHYELLGWEEAKITVRFWIISIILSLLTLLTLKIR